MTNLNKSITQTQTTQLEVRDVRRGTHSRAERGSSWARMTSRSSVRARSASRSRSSSRAAISPRS